eukprot:c45779_g1_i1.p1 GENE.c45779_g1_i1~~c45779_g1_i1.p1  ORF type:complete len:139 (+),score=32.81 c45779_g1_i1:47-463(+)
MLARLRTNQKGLVIAVSVVTGVAACARIGHDYNHNNQIAEWRAEVAWLEEDYAKQRERIEKALSSVVAESQISNKDAVLAAAVDKFRLLSASDLPSAAPVVAKEPTTPAAQVVAVQPVPPPDSAPEPVPVKPGPKIIW